MSNRKTKGQQVSGMDFATVLEEYNRTMDIRSRKVNKNPAGVADAFDRAKYDYSNKPRVKPEKIKGK